MKLRTLLLLGALNPAVLRGRDYIVSHPNVAPSVLNYGSQAIGARGEPDCFPHPMDVLAIHALYQTGYGP